MEAPTYAGQEAGALRTIGRWPTECGFKSRSLDQCSSTDGQNRSQDRKTSGRGPQRAVLGTILPPSALWLVIKPSSCPAQL